MSKTQVFFSAVLLAGFLCHPPAFAGEECGVNVNSMFKKYEDNYALCAEFAEEAAQITEGCIKGMKKYKYDIKKMVTLFMACGLYDEARPYIEEHRKNPIREYNEAFLLEAISLSDEENILEEGLKTSVRKDGDRRRFLAAVYQYYGDFGKALEILEDGLKKEPGFLRIANDLSKAYLHAGNFDKAKYYAEYYLKGDSLYNGPYYFLAETYYYLEDYDSAWNYLKKGNEKNFPASRGPFIEGELLVTEGDYARALKAFKQVKNRYPYIEIFKCGRMENDFANFYIKLYEDEEGIPNVETLEERSDSYYKEKDYQTAGMYDLLLSMIEPKQTSHFYDFAYMMELHGDIYIAVRYYNLYLSLKPDSDKKEEILHFFKSRKIKLDKQNVNCSNYFNVDDCKSNLENCYWDTPDTKCYSRLLFCAYHTSMASCQHTPTDAECYWNSGDSKCYSRSKTCADYRSQDSCGNARASTKCYWNDKDEKCYEDVGLLPCADYHSIDSCQNAPGGAECYWNFSIGLCAERNRMCFTYTNRPSCEDAPDCVWDQKTNKCKDEGLNLF